MVYPMLSPTRLNVVRVLHEPATLGGRRDRSRGVGYPAMIW